MSSGTQKKKSQAPSSQPDKKPPSYLVHVRTISSLNAKEIAGLLGNPEPFTLDAHDPRTILIYSSKKTLSRDDQQELQRLLERITELVSALPSSAGLVDIPNAKTLGDLSARLKTLNCSGVSVAPAGDNKVLITRASSVTDGQYDACLAALRDAGGGLHAERPVEQLYYIAAKDAATALGAKADSADKTDKSGKDSSGGGTSTTITVDNKSQQTVGVPCIPKKAKPSDSSGGTNGANTKNAKKTSSDGSAQDNSGDGDAGDDNNCVASDDSNDKGKSADKSATPAVTITTLAPDLVIFGNDHPGDDDQIIEKKRILAQLDFPRPEVIINTFSFQTSSSKSDVLIEGSRQLQDAVGHYNDNIQHAMERTWRYLDCESTLRRTEAGQTTGFFDSAFVDYLTLPVVADGGEQRSCSGPTCKALPQLTLDRNVRDNVEDRICPADKYCLGYTTLFHPIRQSLTDMLLAVISARDTAWEISQALDVLENKELTLAIQNAKLSDEGSRCGEDCRLKETRRNCSERDVYLLRKAAALTQQRNEGGKSELGTIADSVYRANQANQNYCRKQVLDISSFEFLPLSCFEEEVSSAFPAGTRSNNAAKLLRAALANFLFQYKLSVEYPHDFSPYLLRESAQALDSQLNPLIVAFNRDLAAALQPLQDYANFTNCTDDPCHTGKNGTWFWQGHNTKFVNNGILTVRTVSGKETTVDTITQNFFDATEPPSITDLINSVGQAESNVPKVLKANLTANEAAVIIGALNSVKPAVSKVGREFKIDITPHSLAGASSAELDVHMATGDTADPTRYSNGKSEADNLSRVSQQTVDTKVRLESIKLFEISSFSATLQRSRSNIPIIPPGFEIPYVHSVLSLPVPGASQFHRSTAVMSAVVVPTAADLAIGLELTDDRVLVVSPFGQNNCHLGDQPRACSARPVYSLEDLHLPSIREYNRRKVQCFGTPKALEDVSGPGSAGSSPHVETKNCDSFNLFSGVPVAE